MSPAEARALAMAYELSRLLGELTEQHGAGSRVEDAWDRMEDVIGMLEPDGGDCPRLRLVISDGNGAQP
jgi:hypothetical protein